MIIAAVKGENYACYLEKDASLPFMLAEDLIVVTLRFLELSSKELGDVRSYNLAAFEVSPEKLEKSLKKRFPKLKVDYKIDFRNEIAKGWPESLDSSELFGKLGYKPEHDFETSLDLTIEEVKKLNSTTH